MCVTGMNGLEVEDSRRTGASQAEWMSPRRCRGTGRAGVNKGKSSLGVASTFHECIAFAVALKGPLWISNLLKKITRLSTHMQLTEGKEGNYRTQQTKSQLPKEGALAVRRAMCPQVSFG